MQQQRPLHKGRKWIPATWAGFLIKGLFKGRLHNSHALLYIHSLPGGHWLTELVSPLCGDTNDPLSSQHQQEFSCLPEQANRDQPWMVLVCIHHRNDSVSEGFPQKTLMPQRMIKCQNLCSSGGQSPGSLLLAVEKRRCIPFHQFLWFQRVTSKLKR